jgi:hypothetical protein
MMISLRTSSRFFRTRMKVKFELTAIDCFGRGLPQIVDHEQKSGDGKIL